ncbi:MAG: hypothetical protein ACTSYA_03860 [Candidatus Kariarchaeaceae archaeon]
MANIIIQEDIEDKELLSLINEEGDYKFKIQIQASNGDGELKIIRKSISLKGIAAICDQVVKGVRGVEIIESKREKTSKVKIQLPK